MNPLKGRLALCNASSPRSVRVMRGLVVFVVSGAVMYLAAALWFGREGVVQALERLGPQALLCCALVASISYGVRFLRWHMVLRQSGGYVACWPNLAVYLSGLALTATPAKAGETFRTALLLGHGVPASRSLAAFLVDRSSDVLGVCLLGVVAAWLGTEQWSNMGWVLFSLFAASMAGRRIIFCVQLQRASLRLARRFGRRVGQTAVKAVLHWAKLWTFKNVLVCTLFATCAYGIQALVFAWICRRLDMSIGAPLAVEIFVNATLLGAASLVPGGLGAMEAALVLQLKAQGIPNGAALTAAIAVRLVTLWFGIAVGVLAMGSTVRGRNPS